MVAVSQDIAVAEPLKLANRRGSRHPPVARDIDLVGRVHGKQLLAEGVFDLGFLLGEFQVGVYHDGYQLLEFHLGLPS